VWRGGGLRVFRDIELWFGKILLEGISQALLGRAETALLLPSEYVAQRLVGISEIVSRFVGRRCIVPDATLRAPSYASYEASFRVAFRAS